MLTQLMEQFWDLWPDRVEAHTKDPSASFCYQGNRGGAAINCARTKGVIGVTADPGLARVFHEVCEEIGIHREIRRALAQRAFSDRLHFVYRDIPR